MSFSYKSWIINSFGDAILQIVLRIVLHVRWVQLRLNVVLDLVKRELTAIQLIRIVWVSSFDICFTECELI